MVAGNDNRCIFIKVLLLNPADKLGHLAAGTSHDITILIVAKLIAAQITDKTVLKMGIHRQHCQIERLFLGRQIL